MYYTDRTIVVLDGKFVRAKDAFCSPFSQTMHYGMGVFEGIRAYQTPNGANLFKAKEHFVRLRYAADRMFMRCDYTTDELTHFAYELLEINGLKDAYIRPLLFNPDKMGLQATDNSILFMAAWKWPRYLGDNLLDTHISSVTRPSPSSMPTDCKVNGAYVSSILASTEAKRKGYDEAIMLDVNGNVAQGASSNIFIEKDGELFTPPTQHILAGITRRTLLDLAKEKDIKVHEQNLTTQDLLNADTAILTGTATEVAGLRSVNGTKFKANFKKSKCAELAQAYADLTKTVYEPSYTII